ncbi:MAG: hypothetical protein ACK57D_14050 [Sphingobacteriales bacterium]|jgi:hypothetical protein
MTHAETAKSKKLSNGFNRIMYSAFVLLAVGRMIFQGMDGLAEAAPSLGIALIFDPFDQSVTWKDRPAYQRIWLIVHLSISLALLAWLGYQKWQS